MTVDQIERIVEKKMDRLDARFLRGDLSQDEYDAEIKQLDRWADAAIRQAHG